MRINRQARVTAMFDWFADHPAGGTMAEIRKDLEDETDWTWARETTKRTLRQLRLEFGGDQCNVVCDPVGHGNPYVYRLVGTFAEAAPWVRSRIAHTKAQLITMEAVHTSTSQVSDARTIEGREARAISRGIRRILEDIDEINAS